MKAISRVSPRIWVANSLFLLALAIATYASLANASGVVGQVIIVRSAASAQTPGNTRVSVQIAGAVTSCPYAGWYSYDYPDSGPGSGIGKLWSAKFLAAQASGRSVGVSGTGSCDSYGIETIQFVDAI
jgi:hypothetical protein